MSASSRALAREDKGLARALKAIGAPQIRRRDGGFEGLFRIIVEQQVSVASAQAIWGRCRQGVSCGDAAAVESLGIDGLTALGLSTPKARYVSALAARVAQGELDFDGLARADDAEAMARLVSIKGVGPWTAAIYLLFCEGRADIWPPSDVALKHAYAAASGEEPDQKKLDGRSAGWAPSRGIAAHILWTYYAHLRGRTPI